MKIGDNNSKTQNDQFFVQHQTTTNKIRIKLFDWFLGWFA